MLRRRSISSERCFASFSAARRAAFCEGVSLEGGRRARDSGSFRSSLVVRVGLDFDRRTSSLLAVETEGDMVAAANTLQSVEAG